MGGLAAGGLTGELRPGGRAGTAFFLVGRDRTAARCQRAAGRTAALSRLSGRDAQDAGATEDLAERTGMGGGGAGKDPR